MHESIEEGIIKKTAALQRDDSLVCDNLGRRIAARKAPDQMLTVFTHFEVEEHPQIIGLEELEEQVAKSADLGGHKRNMGHLWPRVRAAPLPLKYPCNPKSITSLNDERNPGQGQKRTPPRPEPGWPP